MKHQISSVVNALQELNSLLQPMVDEGAKLSISIEGVDPGKPSFTLIGEPHDEHEGMYGIFPPMTYLQIKDLLTMMHASGMYEHYVNGDKVAKPKHKGIDTLAAVGLIQKDEFVVTGTYPNNTDSLGAFHAIQVHTQFGNFKIRVSDNNSSLRVSSGDQVAVYPSSSNAVDIVRHE